MLRVFVKALVSGQTLTQDNAANMSSSVAFFVPLRALIVSDNTLTSVELLSLRAVNGRPNKLMINFIDYPQKLYYTTPV